MNAYLESTYFIDFDDPAVEVFAEKAAAGATEPVEIARRLFEAVRDEIRYDPYTFNGQAASLRASHVVQQGRTYCIPKAILMAACARHFGIPARLGFANVRNHLSTGKLIDWLRTDLFVMHGYAELFLDGKWVKATPTFDKVLCRYFNVPPLEFDGVHDAILQPTTLDGKQHMEYLHDHGHFADMPFTYLMEQMRLHYPHLYENDVVVPEGDFAKEAQEENGTA